LRGSEVKLKPFRLNFDLDEIVRDIATLPSGEQARLESDWHSQP